MGLTAGGLLTGGAGAPIGMTLIDTISISASSSTVDITDIPSSSHKYILVQIEDLVSSASHTRLEVLLSEDNGATFITSSTYYSGILYQNSTTAGATESIGTAYWNLKGVINNNPVSSVNLKLYALSTTGVKYFFSEYGGIVTTTNSQKGISHGRMTGSTAAVDAIRLQLNTGTLDSGTVYLWGID